MDTINPDIDKLLTEATDDPALSGQLLKIDTLLADIKKDVPLSEDSGFIVDGIVTRYILDLLARDEALAHMREQLSFDDTLKDIDKVMQHVTNFIDTLGHVSKMPPAQQTSPAVPVAPLSVQQTVATAPAELPVGQPEAPTPAQALASVQERLNTPTVTPPSVRNVSFDIKPVIPIAPAAPKLDLYREMPE